jgi:endonuclease III
MGTLKACYHHLLPYRGGFPRPALNKLMPCHTAVRSGDELCEEVKFSSNAVSMLNAVLVTHGQNHSQAIQVYCRQCCSASSCQCAQLQEAAGQVAA